MIAKRVEIQPDQIISLAVSAARRARRVSCDPAITFDDQVAEGIASITRAVPAYNPDRAEFSTFATRVASNRLIDQARTSLAKRAKCVCETDFGNLSGLAARKQDQSAPAPEVEYELSTRVLLSVLDKTQFAVVILRIEQDLAFAEIGQALGFSESKAKYTFSAAVDKMREQAQKMKLKMEDIL